VKKYSKKYCFIKQSLCKLETEEAKMGSNPTVVETADILIMEFLSLMACLLPLTNPFFFSFFFF